MIDRPVELICTDLQTHDLRELAVVEPVEPRRDLHPLALEAGVRVPDVTADERRGFGVRGSLMTITGSTVHKRVKRDVSVTQSRDGSWTVHVTCPTCGRNPRVPMQVLVRISEALADTPRIIVDVSVLERAY